MYHSLILPLFLLPVVLGLAVSTADAGKAHFLERSTHQDISKRLNILNITKTLDTINGFPDPEVHCSGRSLSDEGDSNYSSDLDTAVTTSTEDGLYGACNVNGDDVDGDGALAFKSGTVQVYFCNHGFAATSCDVNEYWRADALITDQCGADGGGWVTVSDWSLTIGRDPTNSDGSFRSECGNSLHGVNANFVVMNATRSR